MIEVEVVIEEVEDLAEDQRREQEHESESGNRQKDSERSQLGQKIHASFQAAGVTKL